MLIFATCVRAEPLRVVASTTDLAALAYEVGSGYANVEALCGSNQDPHSFEILPQHVLTVQQADIYLKVGAGLDFWADELIKTAGNQKLRVVDCSRGVPLLHDEEEHEHGHHAHELGNPHYWLDPEIIPTVAHTIAEGLAGADREHAGDFMQRANFFTARWVGAVADWRAILEPCAGTGLVTYHRTWDYFARGFNLRIVGTIEPQPGAEPSPLALALLERAIGTGQARILLAEPFASLRLADVLARDTGIAVVVAAPSIENMYAQDAVFAHFDRLVKQIRERCTATFVTHE